MYVKHFYKPYPFSLAADLHKHTIDSTATCVCLHHCCAENKFFFLICTHKE